MNVIRLCIVTILCVVALGSASLVGSKDAQSMITPAQLETFKNGIFTSSYPRLEEEGVIPSDVTFSYYLFSDGLALRTVETNTGITGIEKIGIWRKRGSKIECFFSGNDSVAERFALLQIEGEHPGLLLSPVLAAWDAIPAATLLVKSFGYKEGIEAIETQRRDFLMSFLPSEEGTSEEGTEKKGRGGVNNEWR